MFFLNLPSYSRLTRVTESDWKPGTCMSLLSDGFFLHVNRNPPLP